MRKKSTGDRVFDIVNTVLMVIILLAVLYPFLNSVAISLNDANDTTRGGIPTYIYSS